MNKILLNEINRMHNLMGTNNILSESVNPLVRALSKLSMFENDIITALNKRNVTKLSQVSVNDITNLIKTKKLTKEIIDSFLDTVSEEIDNVITPDIFRKSNSTELLNILSQEGIDPFIGGIWLKRFAKKNKVDTLDKKFRSEFATEVVGDYEKIIFDLASKVTKEEKEFLEGVVDKLQKLSADPRKRAELESSLKKIGISLEESLNRLENNLRASKEQSAKIKLQQIEAIKKGWKTVKENFNAKTLLLILKGGFALLLLDFGFSGLSSLREILCGIAPNMISCKTKDIVTSKFECLYMKQFIDYLISEGFDEASEENTSCKNSIYSYTFEGEKYSFKYKDGEFIGL